MSPTNLKPIQPVYFNLKHEEDKEFWDDIHSNRIPNFTKWVKTQWIIWKQQSNSIQDVLNVIFIENKSQLLQDEIEKKEPEPIRQTIQTKTIESVKDIPEIPVYQEKTSSINVNSLTKMFGMKTT